MPKVNCKICDKSFYVKPSHLKSGCGKYCSLTCKHLGQRKGKYVLCHSCGKEVWKMPKALIHSQSKTYFCTKSCQTLWRNKKYSGPKHPNWKGGEFIYPRIMAKFKIPAICKHCGMEDKRVLVIHHLDHNRKNNDITNLIWLCRNCHYLIHDRKTF